MKRGFALVLTLVLCIGFAVGCKNQQAAPAGPSDPGKTQTAGNLTVYIPEGWSLVSDAANPNQVYICKGGSDLNKNAYVKLTLGSTLPAEGICSNVKTLEARTYGNLTWHGFSGSKSNGKAIYMLSDTGILASLWYTQESGDLSLDDKAVQAILAGVTGTAPSAPEPVEPPAEQPTSIAGDWSGQLALLDCSGEFESKNGQVYQAIARFQVDENGNVTPYIGLASEGGTIQELTASAAGDEMHAGFSGTWNDLAFEGCEPTIANGQLTLEISISAEVGSAQLLFTFKPLTDGSFETLATQLGCTGYPTAS